MPRVPAAAWQALSGRHASEFRGLALTAAHCGFLQIALSICASAAEHGENRALTVMAEILRQAAGPRKQSPGTSVLPKRATTGHSKAQPSFFSRWAG